jgi:hypothetical protein
MKILNVGLKLAVLVMLAGCATNQVKDMPSANLSGSESSKAESNDD